MKKWIVGLVTLIGLTLLFFIWVIDSLLLDEYEVLKESWGIDMPRAAEVKNLITTENDARGDGEWFKKYSYSEPIDLAESPFVQLTNQQVAEANNKIDNFKIRTHEIRQNEQSVVEVFKTNDIQATEGDYYFYKARNHGDDTIVLLYKTADRELYRYEWHQ
ncbi:hypothetical protein [Lysinibacillus sphaericus]|uniref:hypothetical protein n=1 Tax=Lysinibacillus sphaericus TaxID=1421 RepID=UPI001CBB32F2|nr:hypothetical protein [Lysinibacillus sphaericus]